MREENRGAFKLEGPEPLVCCLIDKEGILDYKNYINPALGVCSYHLHFTPPLGFFLGTRNDESGTPSKHCPRAPARLHLLLLTYSLHYIKSLNTKTSSHFMNQRQNKVFNDMHPRANLGSLWNFRFFNLYKSFHFSRATAALK